MDLRRGFKTEANKIAREVRAELGLRPAAPLDPWSLARHVDIPVLPLSHFAHQAREAVKHFHNVERGAFSALTVFNGSHRLIVYNDAHSKGRRASDLAHELAHALLQHRPGPAMDDGGCRFWDNKQEDEATWLAAALLVSEEAALLTARDRRPLGEAAAEYGVSESLMSFRLNVTAAFRRMGGGESGPTRTRRARR